MQRINKLLNKLRRMLLFPGTKLELWLRTKYHNFRATRIFINLMDFFSWRSYRRWRSSQNDQPIPEVSFVGKLPNVSFILSINGAEIEEVKKTIHSIRKLFVDNWEIILVNKMGNPLPSVLSPLTQQENIHYLGWIVL